MPLLVHTKLSLAMSMFAREPSSSAGTVRTFKSRALRVTSNLLYFLTWDSNCAADYIKWLLGTGTAMCMCN